MKVGIIDDLMDTSIILSLNVRSGSIFSWKWMEFRVLFMEVDGSMCIGGLAWNDSTVGTVHYVAHRNSIFILANIIPANNLIHYLTPSKPRNPKYELNFTLSSQIDDTKISKVIPKLVIKQSAKFLAIA